MVGEGSGPVLPYTAKGALRCGAHVVAGYVPTTENAVHRLGQIHQLLPMYDEFLATCAMVNPTATSNLDSAPEPTQRRAQSWNTRAFGSDE